MRDSAAPRTARRSRREHRRARQRRVIDVRLLRARAVAGRFAPMDAIAAPRAGHDPTAPWKVSLVNAPRVCSFRGERSVLQVQARSLRAHLSVAPSHRRGVVTVEATMVARSGDTVAHTVLLPVDRARCASSPRRCVMALRLPTAGGAREWILVARVQPIATASSKTAGRAPTSSSTAAQAAR